MTATVRPPKGQSRRRALRFSSLESLGFSDATFTWSDTPSDPPGSMRGRHEATVADLKPVEFDRDLDRGNVRWGLVTLVVLLLGGLGAFGYWLYQRPAVMEQAAVTEIVAIASEVEDGLPLVATAGAELAESELSPDGPALAAVESNARALFEVSGTVGDLETRIAASEAAEATLDAIRLIRETGSYRAAVIPSLATPDLVTDPDAIELDEAARSFGDWQHAFTTMRAALPDGALPRVTEQLDAISVDLTRVLGEYVDALREDDQKAAELVLTTLGVRLTEAAETMDRSISDITTRIELQVTEADSALRRLLAD